MRTFLQDLRYGARMLAKNPGFTAVAVLTLALGIGASATIFSVVNALLFRPPAGVEDAAGLMAVWNRLPNGQYRQHTYPGYAYYRDHDRTFSGLLAYSSGPVFVSWRRSGHTDLLMAQLVSGNFFSVLGVRPPIGRGFLDEEDQVPGRDPVVVLAHAFWQSRLGADPAVLGKTIFINRHSFTVIGVAPPGFKGLEVSNAPDFWVPLMMQQEVIPRGDRLNNRNAYWIFIAGRLKAGITLAQAQADISVLARENGRLHGETNNEWEGAVLPAAGLPPEVRGDVAAFLALLMTAVGLVLLIACANTAGLMLSRAAGRHREMAIRSAIGASRTRLVCQVLTESLLLSCLAGLVSVLFAGFVGPLLPALKPQSLSFITIDLSLDWRVLAFTLAASLFTAFLAGLPPALHGSKLDMVSRLKDQAGGGPATSRLRKALIFGQVALCVVVLLAAGLCLRSMINAQSVNPGFGVDNRLTVSLDLQILGYSEERGTRFYSQLLERIRVLPGVVSASLGDHLPLGFSRRSAGIVIQGHEPAPGSPDIQAGVMAVGPGYFRTMDIPILRGRDFTARDNSATTRVVVINEAMATRFWPGQDPIGQRIYFNAGDRPSFEIVGVAKTGKYRSLKEQPQLLLYRPFFQSYTPRAVLLVHGAGDPGALLAPVRREIETLDDAVPIIHAQTMNEHMQVPVFPARIAASVLGAFGNIALLLTVVGVYGLVAYSVAQRTRDFGIRMALGAHERDVFRLVLADTARLILPGIGLGLAAAAGVTRLLSSLLYGVSPTDPAMFAGVAILLLAVALLAGAVPARRAARVDPMVALRYE